MTRGQSTTPIFATSAANEKSKRKKTAIQLMQKTNLKLRILAPFSYPNFAPE